MDNCCKCDNNGITRKKLYCYIILLIGLFCIICGCKQKFADEKRIKEKRVEIASKSNEVKKEKEVGTNAIKVTFIELGSVKCTNCKMM